MKVYALYVEAGTSGSENEYALEGTFTNKEDIWDFLDREGWSNCDYKIVETTEED